MNTSATPNPATDVEGEAKSDAKVDSTSDAVDGPAVRADVSSTPSSSRTWSVVAWLAVLLLALCGVVLSASLWVRTNNAQSEVARHVGDVMAQQRERQAQTEALQAQVREVQSRLASAEARVAELSLQRGQLEDLVRGLSRSRDESLVQDLESSVRQAMASAELSGSVQPLVNALQVAMARIARTPQPSLMALRDAMANDLNTLQQADVLDVPRAVGILSKLTQSLDGMAMGVAPAQRPSAVVTASATPPEPMADPQAPFWTRWGDWLSWKWATWWQASADQLQTLVRVREVKQPEAVVLTPEQAVALSSQLKLRLLGARVALLNGQREQVLADLDDVKRAINTFAQLETPQAQTALKQIESLSDAIARGPVPRPEHTLQALAVALSS